MSFLTDFELGLVINFAVFVATLVFAQKIKDWFNGVPADLRSGLKSVEASIQADVKNYQASLVAKVSPAPAPVLKPAVAPLVGAVSVGPAPASVLTPPAPPAA